MGHFNEQVDLVMNGRPHSLANKHQRKEKSSSIKKSTVVFDSPADDNPAILGKYWYLLHSNVLGKTVSTVTMFLRF